MLKLNRDATVELVSNLNAAMDTTQDDARAALVKHKKQLLAAVKALRADSTTKTAHRRYLKAAAACDISPSVLDKYAQDSTTWRYERKQHGLSTTTGTKYRIQGPRGLALVREVLGPPPPRGPRQRRWYKRPTTTPAPKAAQDTTLAPATRTGLVLRVAGHPHIHIALKTASVDALLHALRDL